MTREQKAILAATPGRLLEEQFLDAHQLSQSVSSACSTNSSLAPHQVQVRMFTDRAKRPGDDASTTKAWSRPLRRCPKSLCRRWNRAVAVPRNHFKPATGLPLGGSTRR